MRRHGKYQNIIRSCAIGPPSVLPDSNPCPCDLSSPPPCRVALLTADTRRRSQIAATNDAQALEDSTGVIATDDKGWRILHLPPDFRRRMHGDLEDEVLCLYGIRIGIHYDDIEGDCLPHAEQGQTGAVDDICTLNKFQAMTDNEQLSWLLQKSFYVSVQDESGSDENDGAAKVAETSEQIAEGCACSSTTSLVVAGDELRSRPTGEEEEDERSFGEGGGFDPADSVDHLPGDDETLSPQLDADDTVPPLRKEGESALAIAFGVATSSRESGDGTTSGDVTTNVATRDDPSDVQMACLHSKVHLH